MEEKETPGIFYRCANLLYCRRQNVNTNPIFSLFVGQEVPGEELSSAPRRQAGGRGSPRFLIYFFCKTE